MSKPQLGFMLLNFLLFPPVSAFADGLSVLPGHVPSKQMARASLLGHTSKTLRMQLAVTLKGKDPDGLSSFIARLYDPKDPLYHHFLSAEEFTEKFGPSPEVFNEVSQYLSSQGFEIIKSHSNRFVIDIAGSADLVSNTFQVAFQDYISADGRLVHAPTTDPVVPDSIARNLNGIIGLQTFSHLKKFSHRSPLVLKPNADTPKTSINTYMTPTRLNSVYNLSATGMTGSGETLALFELDGYTASDITAYASHFSLTAPTLQNVLVNGATGTPSTGASSGAGEVTLDIELAVAVAPGLSKIMVYEAPPETNSMTQASADAEVIDTYNKIATDNIAKTVSSSWGSAENETDSNVLNSENTILQQMASQGQSFFAAAGDSGAYDDSSNGTNSTLEVDDPGSQPYATSVGGTTLTWSGNTYSSETSWQTSPASGTYGTGNYSEAKGGGGGISRKWSIPSWQNDLATTANLGSSTMRMVPDVALDADPNTGYPIYYNGAWGLYGGTSCAAPIWAAFTALVNQKRVTVSLARVGFVNPTLYQIGQGASYSSTFHDIADGSTNLYYPAETGYDLTTGFGSFNGNGLFNILTGVLPPSSFAVTPGPLTVTATWVASQDANTYTLMRSTTLNGVYATVASGLTGTSYTDNVANGTYYYYLEAVNGSGTSNSATMSAVVVSAPGAPSNLTATVSQ